MAATSTDLRLVGPTPAAAAAPSHLHYPAHKQTQPDNKPRNSCDGERVTDDVFVLQTT
jgi:hypothetical protein